MWPGLGVHATKQRIGALASVTGGVVTARLPRGPQAHVVAAIAALLAILMFAVVGILGGASLVRALQAKKQRKLAKVLQQTAEQLHAAESELHSFETERQRVNEHIARANDYRVRRWFILRKVVSSQPPLNACMHVCTMHTMMCAGGE